MPIYMHGPPSRFVSILVAMFIFQGTVFGMRDVYKDFASQSLKKSYEC